MNKRKILSLAIIALMGALIAGGTSAYFTYSIQTHNVITMGGVAIELIEDTDQTGADGRPIPFQNIEGAMPGDKISKIPKIKNVDSGEVFVRIRIMSSVRLANGAEQKISPDFFGLDINTKKWTYLDNHYYYNDVLRSGETTEPLFTTVNMPKKMTEMQQGATYSLKMYAEAVQAANNSTNAIDAQGWPEG